jgi:predicted branched-subunit amino acid permease
MTPLLPTQRTSAPTLVRLPALPTRGASFLAGLCACAPLAISIVPLMTAYGVTARAAGLPFWFAQLLSIAVFAGSQLPAVQLYAIGAPGFIAGLVAALMNLRHIIYSVTLAPRFKHLAWPWRLLAGYFTTDETYNLFLARMDREAAAHPQWFLLGEGSSIWCACQGGTALGGWLGQTIPASWSLDFIGTLVFLALLVPQVKHQAEVVTLVTAGGLSVALAWMPGKLGLVVAILGGSAAGWLYQRWRVPQAAKAQGGV